MRRSLTIKIYNSDKAHAQFIMAYLLTSIVYSVSSRICESFGYMINRYLYILSSLVFLWYARSAIVFHLRKSLLKYLVVAIPYSLLFLLSFMRGTNLSIVTSYVVLPLLIYLPMGISAYCVNDYQLFYMEIKKWSYAITVSASFILVVQRSSGFYSMNFSYVLLFATLVHLNEAIRRKRAWFWMLAIYEIVLNLVFGSRGAILCIIAYIAIQMLLSKGMLTVKIPIIIMALYAYFRIDVISEKVLEFMSAKNIHSRTITLLLTRIEYVSGRDVLAANAREMISQKPVFGWGVGAEVQVLGNYPHNIILELMIDYGQVIGLLVFFMFLFLIIKAVFVSEEKSKELLFLFIPSGFVMLFVSSSYLTLPMFYILMGFVLNILKTNRDRTLNDDKE